MSKQSFWANGKLLISGEYFVLDGAMALALPTRYGQQIEVAIKSGDANIIKWKSLDEKEQIWFTGEFQLSDFSILKYSDKNTADRLKEIFIAIKVLEPHFLKFEEKRQIEVTTRLTFPRNWGLGTSSTLIAMLAEWAHVNSYDLLSKTFGGSGYDLACAVAAGPIIYTKNPLSVQAINFQPAFQEQLYFVYLGKKQNSREGIAQYRSLSGKLDEQIAAINRLTRQIINVDNLVDFEELIAQHENIVSTTLKMPKVKMLHFSDYWGCVKSLGAWGGDFVLVTSNRSATETKRYFAKRGLQDFLTYQEMIKTDGLDVVR